MSKLSRYDRRILDELLIDLHDYEGAILLILDRGGTPMPPPSLPGGFDYDRLSSLAMRKIERNRRVAQAIYKRLTPEER